MSQSDGSLRDSKREEPIVIREVNNNDRQGVRNTPVRACVFVCVLGDFLLSFKKHRIRRISLCDGVHGVQK